MRGGTHTFLPTKRVHFGAGSLEKIQEEALAKERVFIVTGRTLYEKTDLIRRIEEILGEKHGGTFPGMGEHTPGSSANSGSGSSGAKVFQTWRVVEVTERCSTVTFGFGRRHSRLP